MKNKKKKLQKANAETTEDKFQKCRRRKNPTLQKANAITED